MTTPEYQEVGWVDGPLGGTPLDAANLDIMDQGIADEDVRNPASPASVLLAAEFETSAQAQAAFGMDVRAWAPNTQYAAGQVVVSPSGDVVSAITPHTSGTTFTGTGVGGNWQYLGVLLAQGATPPSAPRSVSASDNIVSLGSGFTATNALTSNLNDTSDYITGSSAAWAQTKGDGTETLLGIFGGTAISGYDRYVKIQFKAINLSPYAYLKFRVGNNTLTDYYEWTIALNGSSSTVQTGSWQTDTLNWQTATKTGNPNRAALTDFALVMKDAGTGVSNLVHLDAIYLTDDDSPNWPMGVVSITFDDSFDGVWKYARPVMDQYGMRGTVYPIWDRMGQSDRMTLLQHQQLQDQSGWELGTHAAHATLHDQANGFKALSAPNLDTELAQAKAQAYANGHRGPDHFAYPQGYYNTSTLAEVRKVFTSARTTINMNLETAPPADPYQIRAFTVHGMDGSGTPAIVQSLIDGAIANRTWLVLVFHQIKSTSPALVTEYLNTDFTTIINYLASTGVPVRTLGQVLATKPVDPSRVSGQSLGAFGDGSDGPAAFDGTTIPAGTTLAGSTYSLTRDVWYTSAALTNSVTIDTSRYRMFVRDSLRIGSGSAISGDGLAGSGSTAGAGKSTRSAGGGAGGGNGNAGANGNTGATSTTGLGGNGGSGGVSNGAGPGGGIAGGVITNPNGQSVPRSLASAQSLLAQGTATLWTGGAGGASGNALTGSTGGGGGGGATVVPIYARAIVNNGSITARGGAGGAAVIGSGTGAGGGGGGGGGAIVLVYGSYGGSGTLAVAGGAGGAGAGTGAVGAAGNAGTVFKIRV